MKTLLSLFLLAIYALTAFSQTETGTLSFQILDQKTQQPLPAKLAFLKDGEAIELDVPSEGNLATRLNIIYTVDGKGEVSIPVGTYEVWAGRGVEYSADVQKVTIEAGKTTTLTAHIARVVETPGYVCGDMHLHTITHSGHGDANMEERIISCLAEGLEWIVATDHNHVISYDTVMRDFDLKDQMSTTVGNEVTTPIGHFNTYPLTEGSAPVDPDHLDANTLFSSIRKAETKDVVIQVNHPRYPNMAYFSSKNLHEQLGESEENTWSWDFDAFELLNENVGFGWSEVPKNPISVRQDWHNMLHTGRRITALGNSDSHTVINAIAGIPRNYIRSETDDPTKLDEGALAKSIKDGQVSVNQGIYVEFETADGAGIGAEVQASKCCKATFHIRVQAPLWVDCDTVELVCNGFTAMTIPIQVTDRVLRLDTMVTHQMRGDNWYYVVAKGSKSMAPLVADYPTPVTPLGFSNPIWVRTPSSKEFMYAKKKAAYLVEDFANQPQKLVGFLKKYPETFPFLLSEIKRVDPKKKLLLYAKLFEKAGLKMRVLIYETFWKTPVSDFYPFYTKGKFQEPFQTLVNIKYLGSVSKNRLTQLKKEIIGYDAPNMLSSWASINDSVSLPIDYPATYTEIYSPIRQKTYFFFQTTTATEILVNGQVAKTFPQSNLAYLPLKAGKNRITVRAVSPSDTLRFNMEPIDLDGWLNPSTALRPVKLHAALNAPATYTHPVSPKYTGGDSLALTDGLHGKPDDFHHHWLGFEQDDLEVVLDLGQHRQMKEITLSCLHNTGSWIFLPKEVEFAVSADGETWQVVGTEGNRISPLFNQTIVKNFTAEFEATGARYVRVRAQNVGTCPPWHAGAGGKAWLFVDEVTVE